MSQGKYSGMRMHFVSKGIAGYHRYMNFKKHIKTISGNQIVQEKIKVIEFFEEHGSKITKQAFEISRSTVYAWKKDYVTSKYDPDSLIPKSKAPKTKRTLIVDNLVLAFIKQLRQKHHRFGKSKIKPLLYAYCIKNDLNTVSESKTGRIIKNTT